MSDKKHSKVGIVAATLVSILIFGFAGWLLLNRQFAMDQLTVWSYTAPQNIVQISDRVDFTDKGKFYFYTGQPVIAAADDFNKDCPRQEVGSPVLGCYVTGNGRIYIYDITNEQLDGIEEVTAAHEMLHSAWERLSPSEQKKIGSLLRSEYGKLAAGELKERMDYYARTEPGEFENELHSIIGTEVADVGDELQAYYSQFFKDRQKVLVLYAQYSAVFSGLQNEADSLYEQLTALGADVEKRSAEYDSNVAALSSDIDSFNERANNGGFSSLAQFNNERAALVARSDQLVADREAINKDISTYNELYDRYQVVGTQIEVLNKSIDSITNLEPAPSL